VSVTVPVAVAPGCTTDGESAREKSGAKTSTFAVTVAPPVLALTVERVFVETGTVEALKVVAAVPAATITIPGTTTDGSWSASEISTPPAGAGQSSVTVPENGTPPTTAAGDKTMEMRRIGASERFVVLVPEAAAALITAVSVEPTRSVATMKLADSLPPVNETVAGGNASGADEVRATEKPGGAGLPSVTTPFDEAPPVTEAGLNFRPETAGETTFTPTAISLVSVEAYIFDATVAQTGNVVTVKTVEVIPDGIVTLAGTDVEESLFPR
jgi:hypothetical protein